jgi:hypothetical protein
MHTEFPEWLCRFGDPPAEVREKLVALVTPTNLNPEIVADTICMFAYTFAQDEREARAYRSAYDKQKRRHKARNPRPGAQHAGEALERIRRAAMELHAALWEVGPFARRALEKELRHRGHRLYTAGVDPENPRAGLSEYHLHTDTGNRAAISAMLGSIVEATDAAAEKAANRGRPKSGLADLIEGIGRELRYAQGRVPTQREFLDLLRLIFGDGFGGEGEVKRWCREANATAWESEKPENR